MSPILTRPVREQLEHDRIIRLLQVRYRRKFEVAINPGNEQNSSVMVGEMALFPDLTLFDERGKRLEGTVEVETGESVNTLEALAQWGNFSRLKAPFHLYVPPNSLDAARRLCAEHNIPVSEIWTYHTALDQVRFTMVHRSSESHARPKAAARAEKSPDKPVEPPGKSATPPRKAVEKRLAPARARKAVKTTSRRTQPPARSGARGAAKPAARKPAARKTAASKRR